MSIFAIVNIKTTNEYTAIGAEGITVQQLLSNGAP